VNSIEDLVRLAAAEITEPVNIIAQSMGGVIAIRLALAFPKLVTKLVLVATSGGLPVTDFGASDWRPDYFATFPKAARWIADPVEDLSEQIRSIGAPALLIWGDTDPMSPVAIGERLARLLPNSRLVILKGAEHDLAQTHASEVAAEVKTHIDPSSQ
jgi:pimeloyl-ACP methyl ester carboxylesterase